MPLTAAQRKPILAAPDDDTLRASLAASLTAKGDPLGEFIALQLETRRIIWDTKAQRVGTLPDGAGKPANAEGDRRMCELFKKHQADWFGDVRKLLTTCGVSRGFVEWGESPVDRFLDNAQAITAREPLQRLTLTGVKAAHYPELAKATFFKRLRQLFFGKQKVRASDLALLLGNKGFLGLRELSISMNELGLDGTEELARGGFTALEQLAACSIGAPYEAIASLLRAPWFSTLKRAELDDNPTPSYRPGFVAATREQQRDIFDALCALPPGLEHLSLPCPIDDADAERLARSNVVTTLQRLKVEGSRGFTRRGAQALARAAPQLELSGER